MERLKYRNEEAGQQHVNRYEFKFPHVHEQEFCGGDVDIKTEKEATCPMRKNKAFYQADPSGEEYSSGFELEMEDAIVNLNDEIQSLHEELESKNASINMLQDELVKNRSYANELKMELDNQTATVIKLQEELVKKSILISEADKLKTGFNDSIKTIKFLEQSINEKNEALKVNKSLLDSVKMELEDKREAAFLREQELLKKEQELRSKCEKEIQNIKEQYSEQIKDILSKNVLKEKFLEKQIEMLFSRIKELTERGESHQQEYETVKRMYEEEYKDMKSKVDEITKSSGSHIQELNNRLAACLSNEVTLKVELKSKIDDENRLNQELINYKKQYEELLVNDKNLCKRLKQTEKQLELVQQKKEELHEQLLKSNEMYEELKNTFVIEKNELINEQKDIINSFEHDLCTLLKALQDLYHCVSTSFIDCNEDLSNTESDESLIKLPVVSKEAFSNSCFYGVMKIVCDSISESLKLRKEIKNLIQNYQSIRIALDARKKSCDENNQHIAALQNEIMSLEKEKECAVNNLRYVEEQNNLLKYDNIKKQSEMDEINDELVKYKAELSETSQLQQTHMQITNVSLSPIIPDYKVLSDSELINDETLLDLHSKSLPGGNKGAQLATSTPYHKNICDPEAGGEFLKPKSYKSKSELHLSLIKWMEKCHELDKENKRLNTEVENLTLQVQDLKLSSQVLKDEMNAYEEMRFKLEEKLSSHMTLKQQYSSLLVENDKLNNEKQISQKKIDYLKSEVDELSKKNIELEARYGKSLIELTEKSGQDNNSNQTIINSFNEKVQEIIVLKGEIRSLSEEKKYLTHRIDLLLEANTIYCGKIEESYNELISCKTELEKIRNERLDIFSENKLLVKEVQLLQLRLEYITTLRDKHKCSAVSLNQTEDLIQELIVFVKSIMENKLENLETEDAERENNKAYFNLNEILKSLHHQLNEEKVDFDGKMNELENIITRSKDEGIINDDWVLQLDRKLRTIIEEMKYHKEQYNRIEEALRSTGKLHDELQKHKDQLRVKDHEINNFQKKIHEEKMQVKKFSCHVKYLQQEVEEKDEIIKLSVEQKNSLEKELKDLQRKLYEIEKKYEKDTKAAEWKLKQAKLLNFESEVEKKLSNASQKCLRCQVGESGSDTWERVREEVERVYQNALQQVQYFFNAEASSSALDVQEEHKEQIAQLQRIIDEQAIKVGILLKKNIAEDKANYERGYINGEYKKQFDLATFALQQLHQEEIQLLRLQLEAEKHQEIYKTIYENQQNIAIEGISLKTSRRESVENSLSKKLQSTLLEDFLLKFQKFTSDWHGTFSKEVINIKNELQIGINEYSDEKIKPEILKKIENKNQEFLNQYASIIDSAADFLSGLEKERELIMTDLKSFVDFYNKRTRELFEQIDIHHLEIGGLLTVKEELAHIKKEKEELEKMHKNAIELLNADHKTEQAKIQCLLTEIKQCFESGCDPNALTTLRSELEEKYKKELEDLRTYFEEKCANLGKQYSEDVNSLHSRMMSLSSSCSDEMLSDHIGFDKGGAGDNLMFSEMDMENITTLDKLTPEQFKLIEELNYKWSENVKEMKRELEKKYSKKIEHLQERLATFVYNNELDITVRCIKEDVMRDCEIEIEDIKKELTLRHLASEGYSEDNKDMFKNSNEFFKKAICERDSALDQIVDIMGSSLSKDVINQVTIEIISETLKNSDLKEKFILKLSELLAVMEEKLSNISFKLKDKEIQLLNLQNKINSCSQFYCDSVIKLKNLNELNAKRKFIEQPQVMKKFIEGDLEGVNMPPEIIKMKNMFQQLYEKKLIEEKEKLNLELEKLNKFFQEKEIENKKRNSILMEKLMKGEFEEEDWPSEIVQIKKILQQMFEKKMVEEKEKNCSEFEKIRAHNDDKKCGININQSENHDLNRIIQERDELRQMTETLKSAVNQLVSYLSTCEDELNKTVVEELLKGYVETPRKGNSDYESLETTPDHKKVHFAPDVGLSDLDSSHDISAVLRLQLDVCLNKLKTEAASLLGLTALQPPPANLNKQIENLRKENDELQHEISELKLRIYNKQQNESLELKDQFSDDLKDENIYTYLQDKAQNFLIGLQNIPQEMVKILEDIAKLGDNLIHELQKEKIDLQQQIDAADKQLKSTRKFLEEQAAEREMERDDYSKEVTNLQAQLREKGKNLSSHERFTSEVLEPEPQKLGKKSLSVEELEQQLKESNLLLEETEKKKGVVEAELKDAIDKIWVLRDIISDLESQLTSKSEKEALLEQKLDELESELDQQNGTQYAMAQELESLRSQSLDDGYLEQIKQLEENIRVQFNSSVVRQLKTQLRDLEKTLEHRTKELETVYLNNSSNSLSSPSEEVSVREQLEWSRSRTPEPCPSPVALPVEEVSKLQEKFVRHARAEEMLIKRLRDQQLITVKVQVELEEMHAEREVLQKQMKKQMTNLAEANNKIDDLRHKVETAQTNANKNLILQIQELKEKLSKVEQALDSTHNQLMEHKIQLAHAEEIISKQKIEISNLAHCDHDIVDSLRLELAAVIAERNKLEDMLDKYKRDLNLDVVNALLVDKNEDIDHLQHTVNMLQSQKDDVDDDDKQGSCNSKGYRVSFAADIENTNFLPEDIRLRDAPNMQSLDLYPENFQVFGGSISPILHENEEKPYCTSLKSFNLSEEDILGQSDHEIEDLNEFIRNMRSKLEEKDHKIESLEEEVAYLKEIEEDLKHTKSELETVVSSVTDDKKYYENELHIMSERLSKKDDELIKLKDTLKNKDEEILRTTSDVQSLREISMSLQEKLKEAKALAEKENINLLKEDLAHLNDELLSKEKEITDLEHELQLFKNDYNDEKELCETLKNSLNVISCEKLKLEENISSLRHENCGLLNKLQVSEDRLNQYVTAVRNLKNDLTSKCNILENKCVSSNFDVNPIENELPTLQEEVFKLINLNVNLLQERNDILDELNNLKSAFATNDFAIKDSLITQLKDELNELKRGVHTVKEEKLEAFSNFSKEICQLHKDIERLQDSKQEALQQWKQELTEKQTLQKKFESLQIELEAERCINDEKKLFKLSRKERLCIDGPAILDIQPAPCIRSLKIEKLSLSRLGIIDIQPVSNSKGGMDALTDKMRKEIKLSATLDNSLLESILPESSDEFLGPSEASESVGSQFVTITSKLRSLERALLSEMEKAQEARNGLREKEKNYRVSEAEKSELKLRIERLGRLLGAQEEKITILSNHLKTEKDKVITLELMVSKEQASLKKMSALLDEERNKTRESQKEDIALIETMRKRLQSLMENETILKQMVRDERQKSNQLLAQLNSVRAIEQYRSDSEDEIHKKCEKLLLQERDKYFQMKVECEKERRTCEDLREVLARERTALCYLQNNLAKSEKARNLIEKEITMLRQKLNEEIMKREIADRRVAEIQEEYGDTKFQKHYEALESRNKKSLEAAYAVIRELEQEYNDLKIYIRSQQEQDERWKDRVHLPLIHQLNEVNDNLDALIKERVELKRTIDRINEENNRLHSLVNDLKRMTPTTSESPPIGNELEIRNVRLQLGSHTLTPFIDKEIDDLLERVLRAERHKKALVFQKRYLLVALRGYQEAHSETLHHLQHYHYKRRRTRKISFRCVVLLVIATFKIRSLPSKRMIIYHKRKELLLSNLQKSLSRSSAEMERLTSAPTGRRMAPHSPPSRDRATLRFR